MKVILNQKEIGEALIKYLAERGINTTLDRMFLEHNVEGGKYVYSVLVKDVQIAPKDGPFR